MINSNPLASIEMGADNEMQCRSCARHIPFQATECRYCGGFNLFMGIGEFRARYADKQFMDIRSGGYIIGRETAEDDIPLFQFWGENALNCMGLMQGQEYVLSSEATVKHRNLLEEINSEQGDINSLPEVTPKLSGNVIDVRLCNSLHGISEYGGVLISPGQFVINRFATKKHFATLERINSRF